MKHSNIVYFSLILLFVISSCGNRSANNSSIYSFDTPTIDVENSITVRDTVRNVSSLMFQNTGIYDTTYRHTSDSLLAIRHKGIIVKGKSSTDSHKDKGMFYLPVNEQYQYIEGGKNSDIVFEFYLPDGFKSSDSIILSYKLKGAHDFTSLSKKINNSSVVGGMYFKRDTSWSLQREELPYFALKKGKNIFRYELPNGVSDIVAIKDIQLNIISKNKRGDCVIVNQPDNRCFYRTFGYLQGFIDSEAKLFIDGKPIATDKGFFETIVHRKTIVGDSWLSTLEVLYPNGKKIRKEVQFICSTDYDFSSTKGTYSQRIEQTITPDNGFDISLLGARLTGEKGGVATSRNLSITALRSIDMSVVSSDIINVTAEAAGYRFLPSGLKFDTVHIMAMSYEPKLIPQGYTADDVFTFYYDEQTQRWQRIERSRVDTVNHIIYSYTDHFTDYINGILKAPELPDVQAYVPTTIKDLQAAHPHTGIGSFSVPEANNKGTANTSMPLWVPAGRNGLQPNLILAYNSAGGNGWLGQGWDIPISSIEVETRWGVPLYDTDYETETYLLDGTTLLLSRLDNNNNIVLIEPTYRRDFDKRIMDSLRLYREIEGAFQKIVRYGNSPSEYYFVVTDKNGTKMTYGNDGSSNNVCEQKDQIGNKAKWLLTKIEDANGNWMKFSYQTKSYQGGSNIYIKDIEYTGNGNEGGNYLISFKLSNAIRPDVMSNGRKGLFEVSAHLLDRIDVIYKVSNEVLRQYYFGYQKGAYGKTLLSNMLDVDSTFRNDGNINIFTKNDIFDRNATRESAKNYYPIKYYFSYHTGNMRYSRDQEIAIANSDVNSFDLLMNRMIRALFNPKTDMATLGGSTGTSWGAGGAFSVGFGFDCFLKTFSSGGNYSYSDDQNAAFMTLVDLNGDGYPDKLFKTSDGKLGYRLQQVDSLGRSTFSSSIGYINTADFNTVHSYSHTFGFEGQAKIAKIGASFGVEANVSKSETNIYLSDVDGNGLVDIVDNDRGKVYFNRFPRFSDEIQNDTIWVEGSSSCKKKYILNNVEVNNDVFKIGGKVDTIVNTECKLVPSFLECPRCSVLYMKGYIGECYSCQNHRIVCKSDTTYVYESEKALYTPDIQSVRAWIAPYSGIIKISGIAELSKDLKNTRIENNIKDGVTLYIQNYTYSKLPPLIERSIYPTVGSLDTVNMNIDLLGICKGTIIYFVVRSNTKHTLDVVNWNPKIEYLKTYDYENIDTETILRNPKSFTFDAAEDFVLNGEENYGLLHDGTVRIEYDIKLDHGYTLPDNVYLVVRHSDIDVDRRITYTNKTYLCSTRFDMNGSYSMQVTKSGSNFTSYLDFYLDSQNKLIDWAKVSAKVRVYYTNITSSMVGGAPLPVIDSVTNPNNHVYTTERFPIVNKRCLQYAKRPSIKYDRIAGTEISVSYSIYDYNQQYFFLMLRDAAGKLIKVFPILITHTYDTYNIHTNFDNVAYIDFYTEDAYAGSFLYAKVYIDGREYKAGIHTNYFSDKNDDFNYRRFKSIYRGWTQFGYKPKSRDYNYIDGNLLYTHYTDLSKLNDYIPDTTKLIVDIDNFDINSNIQSKSGNKKSFNPLAGNFFPMTPDAKTGRYVSYANIGYIARDTMSNAIINQSIEEIRSESFPTAHVRVGEKPKTVIKRSAKDFPAISVRGNVSLGPIGISGSYSKSTSRSVSEYMDMNGDRYPDILSIGGVQYSKPQGGLSNKIVDFSNGALSYTDISVDKAGSVGASGNKNETLSKKTVTTEEKNSITRVIQAGGNVGAGFAAAFSDNKASWQDINGDGLPDRVIFDENGIGKVYFNMGYSFTEAVKIPNIQSRNSLSFTANSNISIGVSDSIIWNIIRGKDKRHYDLCLSFSGGMANGNSINMAKQAFMDVNGDGLVDIVEYSNNQLNNIKSAITSSWKNPAINFASDRVFVRYNLGTSFSPPERITAKGWSIQKSLTNNFSVNGAGSFGFGIGIFPVKFVTTLNAYYSWNVTNDKSQLMDFNNDGYLDFVRVSTTDNNKIIVTYAEPSATNLLASIVSPTNMSIDIDYALTKRSTVDNPSRHWEMTECKSKVFEKDPNMMVHFNKFEYRNRKYDRFEREDYGYDKVVTTTMTNSQKEICNHDRYGIWEYNDVYATATDSYINDGSIFRGLKTRSELKDRSGKLISTEDNTFSQYDIKSGLEKAPNDLCLGGVYPALKATSSKTYEGNSYIEILKQFRYGKFGNAVYYRSNYGSTGDFVEANMEYHSREVPYIVGTVSSMKYKASNSNIPYSRTSKIDSRGNISEINNNGAINSYYFDRYGNTTRVFYPANSHGERKSINIEYDGVLKSLPVSVTDMEGYRSTTVYDYRYQVPTRTTDIGGSVMLYSYDTKGRLKSVKTPKDPVYTVKYQYWDMFDKNKFFDGNKDPHTYPYDDFKWVETSHYNVDYPSMPIKTVVFADGFGRIDATVKFIDLGDGSPRHTVVYGAKCYDAVGNVVKEYTEPVLIDSIRGVYSHQIPPTNEGQIPIQYALSHDLFVGNNNWISKHRIYTLDTRGRAIAVREPDGTVSRMAYAIDGGLSKTSVTDALGNTSHVWRDARGQTVKTQSPMGAVTQFRYDGLGELLQTIDPEGHTTRFYYDHLGRTIMTKHPSRGWVKYAYDGATANVAAERTFLGEIKYKYDRLGRQIEKRYSENPQNNVFYQYGSPSDGRNSGKLVKVQDATGVTEYMYDNMGEIQLETRMHILFNGWTTFRTIRYSDSWGRTKYMIYPDGEHIKYVYNKTGLLSRIESMKSINTNTPYIKDIHYNFMEQKEYVAYGNGTYAKYKYDPLMYRLTDYSLQNGNGTILSKNYNYNSIGNVEYQRDFYKFVGVSYDLAHKYKYDADNRLYYGNGSSNNSNLRYDFEMKYSPSGKILNKNLNSIGIKNGNIMNIQYQNPYHYNETNNPYAVSATGNGWYTHDSQHFCWDAVGNMANITTNDSKSSIFWTEDNRMQAYTSIGDKTDLAYYRYDHTGKREMKLRGRIMDVYNMGYSYSIPYYDDITLYSGDFMTIDSRWGVMKHYFVEGERFLTNCGNEAKPWMNPTKALEGIEPEDPKYMCQAFTDNIIGYFRGRQHPCDNFIDQKADISSEILDVANIYTSIFKTHKENDSYYLHTDRLGSGSAVTDGSGEAVHLLGYMPYGETLLDLSQDYETPYQFTGYEKDQETGLHYAEARYYDSWLSTFNSTDPMWYKYPHQSPYAYCADNPVMLVDPDGMETEPVYDLKGNHLGNTKEGFTGRIIIYSGDRKDFSSMTAEDLLNIGSNSEETVSTFEKAAQDGAINNSAKENIVNHVLSQAEGKQIFDKKFSMKKLKGGKVSFDENAPKNELWATYKNSGQIKFNSDHWNNSYEATVENIQATGIIHEWYSHKLYKIGDHNHSLAYKNIMNSIFWNAVTDKYKSHIKSSYKYFLNEENRGKK